MPSIHGVLSLTPIQLSWNHQLILTHYHTAQILMRDSLLMMVLPKLSLTLTQDLTAMLTGLCNRRNKLLHKMMLFTPGVLSHTLTQASWTQQLIFLPCHSALISMKDLLLMMASLELSHIQSLDSTAMLIGLSLKDNLFHRMIPSTHGP